MLARAAAIALGVCVCAAVACALPRPAAAAAPTLNLAAIQPGAASEVGSSFTAVIPVPADILADAGQPLSIDDATNPGAAKRFLPLGEPNGQPPYQSGWLRFGLRAQTVSGRWVLLLPPSFGEADLYVPHGRGYALMTFGMDVPYARRADRDLPTPVLPITREMLSGKPLYLHFTFHGYPLRLFASTRIAAILADRDAAQHDLVWLGIYIAIGISNCLLFFYLRDRTFLDYAVVMAATVLFLLVSFSWAWMWLWPWASVPWMPVRGLALGLWFVAIANVARNLLELPTRARVLDRLLVGATAVFFCWIQFLHDQPWLGHEWLLRWWLAANLPQTAFCLVLLGAGVEMQRRGMLAARFYLAGFAGFVAGFFTLLLTDLPAVHAFVNALPWPLSEPNQAGIAWEGLFLTIAIADRVRSAKTEALDALVREREALQQLADAQQAMVARLSAQGVAMERFVPRAFLEHLGKGSVEELELGDNALREMTLLFSDIRSFTTLAESMSARETFNFLNSYLTRAGPIIRENHGFIDKYIGDAIMALFAEGPNDGLDAAIALQIEVGRYNQDRGRAGYRAIAIGVGLHHGPLALGAIGESRRIETTVIADAVNIASRLEGLTKIFGARIIASRAVIAPLAAPERYHVRSLGRVQVKGALADVEVCEVFDADPPDLIGPKRASLDEFAQGIAAYHAGDLAGAEARFARIVSAAPADRGAAYFLERCRVLSTTGLPEDWDGVERLEVK